MKTAGDMFLFLIRVIRKTPRIDIFHFLAILCGIMIESLPVILIFGVSIGASIGLQFVISLKVVGAESMSPYFSGMAILREIGPMVAGSQVLIRSGTRIVSQIASMKDRGILTAIEVFPLDSFLFVVVPRFWAIVIATFLYLPIANAVCILSSAFLTANLFGVSWGEIWNGLEKSGDIIDILIGFLKCGIIGISNALFVTYYGWTAKEGAEGTSKAMQKAISYSVVYAIAINYSISLIFYE
ncbi:putative phospholipid ABC transporter permease protein MlaE [bacterium HR19]|nr:putative phospholipid ABC transporter permease protein MlaE [bacterium HR19]